MKILKKIIAVFLAVTLAVTVTGCAYNHPNAILRDASYGATAGALPGLAMMALLSDDEGADAEEELGFFGLSLIVLGGGALAGLAIGSVIGVFHWMYETATWQPPEEQVPPPLQPSPRYESEMQAMEQEPTAVRQYETAVEDVPAAEQPAVEQIDDGQNAEEDFAPQAIER